ncbi:MAG: hypothetical protein P4L50_00540, partial [Anaerolineaceae bacterium]|nr:hypothetical protein [Anaerolineaceae bacterium]
MVTGVTHKEVLSDPDQSDLSGLTSFAINNVLTIYRELTPAEVAVLCSLLTSGAAIEHLAIRDELPPGTGAQLGLAISTAAASTPIRTLTLGRKFTFEYRPASELLRALAVVSANSAATLEQLIISGIDINDWCEHNSFGKFDALRSLTIRADKDCSRAIPSLVEGVVQLRDLASL